jgi:hypothetical protein
MHVVIFSALVLCQPTARPAPVAMVLEVKGKVEYRPASGASRRAATMDLLYPGDHLHTLTDGEALLIILETGVRERLKATTKAALGKTGCEADRGVERQEWAGPARKAVLAGLKDLSRGERLAGTVTRAGLDKKPATVTPLTGATVLEDRPKLTWELATKATAYQVEIWVKDSQTRVLTESVAKPPFAFPTTNQKPLKRGLRYTWRILAVVAGGDLEFVVESDFLVASDAEVRELESVKALVESTNSADVLLAAVTYEAEDYRLYDRALAAYERLCQLRPNEAAFQAARATRYERAGRPDAAAKAWEVAEKLGFVRRASKASR